MTTRNRKNEDVSATQEVIETPKSASSNADTKKRFYIWGGSFLGVAALITAIVVPIILLTGGSGAPFTQEEVYQVFDADGETGSEYWDDLFYIKDDVPDTSYEVEEAEQAQIVFDNMETNTIAAGYYEVNGIEGFQNREYDPEYDQNEPYIDDGYVVVGMPGWHIESSPEGDIVLVDNVDPLAYGWIDMGGSGVVTTPKISDKPAILKLDDEWMNNYEKMFNSTFSQVGAPYVNLIDII